MKIKNWRNQKDKNTENKQVFHCLYCYTSFIDSTRVEDPRQIYQRKTTTKSMIGLQALPEKILKEIMGGFYIAGEATIEMNNLFITCTDKLYLKQV